MSKNTAFSKIQLFQKHSFSKKHGFLSKNRSFKNPKSRPFQNPAFQKTAFFVIKGPTILHGFLPQIMANNTLGEWSDGDDDWVFEIDESLWNNNSKDDGNEALNQTATNTLGENCDVSMWAKMSKYKRDDQKQ